MAVDDELIQLKLLVKCIKGSVEDGEIAEFDNSVEALEWARENQPDVAFCDIQMPVITGIELAKELKKLHPQINIIFVTGYYEEYASQAMDVYFSGYVHKPVTVKMVETAMQNLRYPLPIKQRKKIRIQCFGNFEVYVGDQPLKFERSKTKELLAYLVDRRGALVTVNEICAALFENELNEQNNKGYLRKCTNDLKTVLSNVGAEHIFVKGYNKYGIVASEIECDYYDWEKNEPYAIRSFRGEYMHQYSWSEETLGNIINELGKIK